MNGLPYYKKYPRDFIEATIGWPFELKAAYGLALDLIYMQDGQLPNDSGYISGQMGLTVKKWNILRNKLIEKRKIKVSGEFLTNFRADKELEVTRKFRRKQSVNGSGSKEINDLVKAKPKPKIKPNQSHTESESESEKSKRDDKSSPKKQKVGSRIPDLWIMPAEYVAFADNEGMGMEEISDVSQRFHDYWLGVSGQRGTKMDWLAVWRNWIRKHNDEKGQTNVGKKRTDGGSISRSDGEAERVRRVVGGAAAGTSTQDWAKGEGDT